MISTFSKKRRRKASVMIEFALIFPLALAIMLFGVDMGRVALLSTGLHDAASVAARAGARQGFVGTNNNGPAHDAFYEAVAVTPGLEDSITSFNIVSPSRNLSGGARTGKWCTNNELYVKVQAKARIDFITPGVGALLNAFSTDDSGIKGFSNVATTGVARCEVTRG